MSLTAARATYIEAVLAFKPSDARIQRLHEIIEAESLLTGQFTLSSGRTSTYLFQLRQTTMHPEGASLIGDLITDFMKQNKIRCLGGMELGAVPIVSATAAMSCQKRFPVSAFFVRKQAKQHGTRERIDGHIRGGEEVLVVDDVTTSGQSMIETIDAISDKGCKITKALSIVDREEGAAEKLAARDVTLYSLFKRSDFEIG